MLHNPFSTPMPASAVTRPTLQLSGLSSLHRPSPSVEAFSDSRTHAHRGPSRAVTLYNASSAGGSAISKSPDGERCAVVGKDSIRILRVSDGSERPASEHRYNIGKGGFRVDASKNFWSGNGLKVDSAMTDVVWCHKAFDTKIVTSARNGELMLWDLHKSGTLKCERKERGHSRSINKLSYSSVMPHYCTTGSSDGNLRVWDLRNISKSSHHVKHQFAIRTVLFSPSPSEPLHAFTGLDNGSMCRWDLRMGQKGLFERVPLAHTGAILSLDWRETGVSGGWLSSAGLDRTVKVWDLSDDQWQNQSSRKPAYVLHTSYPVRRVTWRLGYETELAVASYNESAYNPTSKSTPSSASNPSTLGNGTLSRQSSLGGGRAEATQHGSAGSELSLTSSGQYETQGSGDRIEIWDVRRPWIAKWTVDGSGAEGGVSDMTFADSHALWVQHPSGAFSQMDLRFCDKPIDSVSRTAVTWSPNGSLTFVSDKVVDWEVPYDDMPQTANPNAAEKTEPHKKLGDSLHVPMTQTVGTIFEADDAEDWDAFGFLARGYKIEGSDQLTLCEMNAETAFEAGNYEAGRIWLLLRSLLVDIVSKPPSPPLSRKNSVPALPHSTSAPAGVPTVKRSPPKGQQTRSSSSDPLEPIRKVSEKRSGVFMSGSMVMAPSLRSPVSPALSQSVAGHENGMQSAVNEGDYKIRRKSVNVATLNRPRRLSSRRNSTSKMVLSEDRQLSSRSRLTRQVGEGALDDSDSSDENVVSIPSEQRHQAAMRTRTSHESFSSSTGSSRPSLAQSRAMPSPVLPEDNEWAEDEKDDSVSPASSSDFDSDNSVASTTAARSSSARRPTRSRSSTLASMAASSILQPRQNLPRTDSHSSVLTVTAGGGRSIPQEQPVLAEAFADAISLAPSNKSRKRHSQVFSLSGVHVSSRSEQKPFCDEDEIRFLEWNQLAIKEAEGLYRKTAWRALQEVLERLAESGDVQMCAMLACVAPTELDISGWRALQFIEAYIDILSRFRMHEVLAYIRKYAPSAEVRQTTQTHTTIYTMCATCRKPIMTPAQGRAEGVSRAWTGFSQCFECKKAAIMCTICHLPVRSTVFVCAVCSHGGHRDCYHQYYMRRPMVELSTSTAENRGRRGRSGPSSDESAIDDSPDVGGDGGAISTIRLMGHPCAAGCGHFCWTASEKLLSL